MIVFFKYILHKLRASIMPMLSACSHVIKSCLIVLLTTLLFACGGGGSGDPTPTFAAPTAPGTVKGIVQDGAGVALAGATVTALGQTVTTAADGAYSFATTASLTEVLVLVKKSGYTTVAKAIPNSSGVTTQSNIQVFADQVTTTFNSTVAASIAVKAAKVQIPANGLTYADGSAFSGTARIAASYYSPDTVEGVKAFAGPYLGDDAGVQSPIISMGFVEVKLTDTSGKALQLKAGSLATLTIPASSNAANAADIPLWFYDEAAGIWKREGSATRQADGTYQGTVKHFTIWNADFKGVTATIKGCFVDSAGNPLSNVGPIGLRTTGWNNVFKFGINAGDAAGSFTLARIPANVPLELYSANTPSTFTSVNIPALSAGEFRDLGACITASQGAAGSTVTVTSPTAIFIPPVVVVVPPVSSGNVAAYAADYIGTYSGAESGTFVVKASTTGVITGTVFSQTFGQAFPVNGQVSSSGGVTLSTGGTAGSAQFSGSINAAGVISGKWNYFGVATGGTFTGTKTISSTIVTGIDSYVGTWVACTINPGGTSSEKEVITFTKTSATTLSWVDTLTTHNGSLCAGTGSNSETDRGTLQTLGTKLADGLSVDKVQVTSTAISTTPINGASFTGKTITVISGNLFRFGDYTRGLDTDGFPIFLAPDVAIRQ
jgi:hypothetical protein